MQFFDCLFIIHKNGTWHSSPSKLFASLLCLSQDQWLRKNYKKCFADVVLINSLFFFVAFLANSIAGHRWIYLENASIGIVACIYIINM